MRVRAGKIVIEKEIFFSEKSSLVFCCGGAVLEAAQATNVTIALPLPLSFSLCSWLIINELMLRVVGLPPPFRWDYYRGVVGLPPYTCVLQTFSRPFVVAFLEFPASLKRGLPSDRKLPMNSDLHS